MPILCRSIREAEKAKRYLEAHRTNIPGTLGYEGNSYRIRKLPKETTEGYKKVVNWPYRWAVEVVSAENDSETMKAKEAELRRILRNYLEDSDENLAVRLIGELHHDYPIDRRRR